MDTKTMRAEKSALFDYKQPIIIGLILAANALRSRDY